MDLTKSLLPAQVVLEVGEARGYDAPLPDIECRPASRHSGGLRRITPTDAGLKDVLLLLQIHRRGHPGERALAGRH